MHCRGEIMVLFITNQLAIKNTEDVFGLKGHLLFTNTCREVSLLSPHMNFNVIIIAIKSTYDTKAE